MPMPKVIHPKTMNPIAMKLSKDFSLHELIHSPTAVRLGLNNNPGAAARARLEMLVNQVLQPARDALGPIRVTSGYRSWAVNTAVGGSKTSQHARGEAADLVTQDNRVLFEWIRANCPFDQLIWEFGDDRQPAWVHVSIAAGRPPRGEVLRAYRTRTGTQYKRI